MTETETKTTFDMIKGINNISAHLIGSARNFDYNQKQDPYKVVLWFDEGNMLIHTIGLKHPITNKYVIHVHATFNKEEESITLYKDVEIESETQLGGAVEKIYKMCQLALMV